MFVPSRMFSPRLLLLRVSPAQLHVSRPHNSGTQKPVEKKEKEMITQLATCLIFSVVSCFRCFEIRLHDRDYRSGYAIFILVCALSFLIDPCYN